MKHHKNDDGHQLSLWSCEHKLIVSIYDYTGKWVQDYINAGYPVLLWDYKVEGCILENFHRLYSAILEAQEFGYQPYGLLAAPPCTDISAAGAQYWQAKDITPGPPPFDSVTEYATALVLIVLHLRDLFNWKFWVVENPPGRMEALVPELIPFRNLMFQPWEFGDAITKRTVLWGVFNSALYRTPVAPKTVKIKTRNRFYSSSEVWAKTGGKSDKTKTLRSNTPKGFAHAFFNANK